MVGRQDRDQGQLFYEFNLDEVVPKDPLLRGQPIRVPAGLPASRCSAFTYKPGLCAASWRHARWVDQGAESDNRLEPHSEPACRNRRRGMGSIVLAPGPLGRVSFFEFITPDVNCD